MPRIRDAMRSGWNTSSWSTFSPTEANFTGRPVTALAESAAPPRASPSSFVSTMPSKAIRSWKAFATLTASCPVIASSTSRTFKRLDGVPDLDELVHQRLVDLEAAGGVDDHDVAPVRRRARETVARRDDRIGRLRPVDRHLELAAELLELVDRRRPLEVCGHEPRGLLLVLAKPERELGRRGRLSRALEPAEDDHRRRSTEDELRVRRAHQLRQLLVDDLHHLLAGLEPLEDVLAEGPLADGGDELLHDLEVDVGLEQCEADLARCARDGLLVEAGAPSEVAHGVLEAVGERVEHGCKRTRSSRAARSPVPAS